MRIIGALALLLTTVGCGYHAATSGLSSQLPASIHSIYVPAFANKTTAYNVDTLVTQQVVRELENRTKYKIVLSARDDADATLAGTILSEKSSPLTYDSKTGRASSALVIVTASLRLTDRHGKVLYENAQYSFREQYQVSRELSSFFQEDSAAIERISRDFARQAVSDILEAF